MKKLLDDILREKARIAESLAQGVAEDFAQYQALVGQYAGLQKAQNMVEAILRADEDDN